MRLYLLALLTPFAVSSLLAQTAGSKGASAARTRDKAVAPAQKARQPVLPAPPQPTPDRAHVLLGSYGPYRANNDLLSYHLTLRVDPRAKSIAGSNAVRFRMLEDATRIQLDLTSTLAVDSIRWNGKDLHFLRDSGAVFIDFPETLPKGATETVEVAYHGNPIAKGRFGGMSFDTDPAGRPWIYTADEDDGCSIWFPCKDQWADEPQDGTDLSVAVPNGLMDVSNGRLTSHRDLGDGYTEWNWHVSYPINSYDIALNIGAYAHFASTYNGPGFPPLSEDFYALPEDLDKAKRTFPQSDHMLAAFEHYFGEYPFARDGYKLVQVPYTGMEHQSAVSYGNGFDNGYLHRDWTGVGISPRFDFIIIHESGHEWFGNAVSAADRSSMWIHEGWDTYLETLFVEYHYGRADAQRYTLGLIPHIQNRQAIVSEFGVNAEPPQDMYFKAALMIASLRSWLETVPAPEPTATQRTAFGQTPGAAMTPISAADIRWYGLLHDFYQHFKYTNSLTPEAIAWWNQATASTLHTDLTPFFNQYLRHTAVPALELTELPPLPGQTQHMYLYKWQATEPGFNMPIRVGLAVPLPGETPVPNFTLDPATAQTLHPTQTWQTFSTPLSLDQLQVDTAHFYINTSKN